MAMAEQESTNSSPAAPFRPVGARVNPANDGDLGYLYTIYRFYDAEDRILFLGHSERIRQRIVDEEIGHPRGLPLGHDDGPKPWWREAARIELEHLPPGTTGAEARVEERRQIELLHPVYNREFNEINHDRSRVEQAIDRAHFEVDVATAEHDRHDGFVRPIDQVAIEASRAADRLRPSGSARLRSGLRSRSADRTLDVGPIANPNPVERRSGASARGGGVASTARRGAGRFDGPGSVAGMVVVFAILVALVIFALVVSIRAVV
ncbi:MAG: hypothetical protein AAFO29_12475 [Actinomycetota bacterium]